MCGFSTVKEMECIKHSTVDGKNPSWHSVCFDLHVTKWIKQSGQQLLHLCTHMKFQITFT